MTRDGSWAVTGGDDAIKVWDLGTGIERTNAPIGVGPVAVSRDGRAVCLSRADDPIVWDVATGEAVLELAVGSVDEEGLDLVGVGIAGSSLVLAERDRVRVWDLATGAARDLDALDDGEEITEVALSADGRRAVVATLDSAIILWDLDAGGALRRRPGYHGDGLGLTPDGRLAIWVCEEHGLAIHDLETGEIRESGGGLAEVYALYVTSDGGHVVTAGADRAVRVWNLTSWDTEALVALDGHVWCVAMSDDGCLAAGVGAGDVWCLDYRNGKLQRT
jgi:WD40 repeat protein